MQDNIVQYPDSRAIEEEAADWVVKLDGDIPPSPEELAELKEWLGRSSVHRNALASMAHFWNNNMLTELSVPLGKKDAAPRKQKQRRFLWQMGFAGAMLVIIASVILFSPWILTDKSNGFYVTAVGQQKTVSLSDGSSIQLNTNSQVDVSYSGDYRDIHLLQGEVHFTVARNKSRPFRVYVGNSRVEAVGTAFTVYARGADIDITVTEGKVLLEALHAITVAKDQRSQPVMEHGFDKSKRARKLGWLNAGQKSTVRESGVDMATIAEIKNVDSEVMEYQLSWRKGFLSFNGETLQTVVDEISRYTTVRIDIVDPSLRDIEIGGQLKVGETESMLNALEANFGLEVTRVGYNYVQLSAVQN